MAFTGDWIGLSVREFLNVEHDEKAIYVYFYKPDKRYITGRRKVASSRLMNVGTTADELLVGLDDTHLDAEVVAYHRYSNNVSGAYNLIAEALLV